MAKKTKKIEVEEPQIQEEVAVQTAPVIEKPKNSICRRNAWRTKNGTYCF